MSASASERDYRAAEGSWRAETSRDLAFALLVAVLLTLSPLTGAARLGASALLGALGGIAVFVMRRRSARPAPQLASARPSVPASVGVAGIALLAALAPTLVWLYGQFTESVWRNQHGLFVPFFMVLAGLSVLRRDPHPEREESSAWGFAFLVPAALLLVADAGMGSRFLSAAGLALLPPGLALLLLGARRARALAVPLALGVFLIPTPEHLGDPLGVTWMSAVGSEWLTRALGIPVERLGTMLTVNGHPFEVSQNCGGLATLHAATAFAVMLAALGARRRIAPLLLAVYPLTVAANAVRCCGLMVATSYSPRLLDTPLHGLSGLAVFWSVVGALWCLADRRAVRENLS